MYIESGCLSCIAVAVPLVVVVLLIACAGIFIIVAYTLKRKNRVYYDKTNGTNR